MARLPTRSVCQISRKVVLRGCSGHTVQSYDHHVPRSEWTFMYVPQTKLLSSCLQASVLDVCCFDGRKCKQDMMYRKRKDSVIPALRNVLWSLIPESNWDLRKYLYLVDQRWKSRWYYSSAAVGLRTSNFTRPSWSIIRLATLSHNSPIYTGALVFLPGCSGDCP